MKIQWKYDFVDKLFCEQLKAMGSQWIESDTDVSELTNLLSGRARIPATVAAERTSP